MPTAAPREQSPSRGMISCVARRDAAQIRFVLSLRPFIAEWQSAISRFSAGLTGRLVGLSEPRASDWSAQDSPVLGERICRCSLFSGASSVTLSPGELALSFSNVRHEAYPVVFDVLSRTLDLMRSEFSAHPYEICDLTSTQHADALDEDSVHTYLLQFTHAGTISAVYAEPSLEYEPSVRIVLVATDRKSRIQRIVERSALRPRALFVSTQVSCASDILGSGKPQEIQDFFVDSCRHADEAIALNWESAQ